MPLDGIVIKSGATGITVVGGVDKTFNSDGVQLKNGIHLSNTAATDLRLQEQITFSNKVATLLSDGQFSKDRKVARYTQPFLRTDGKIVFPLMEVRREIDPGMTAAQIFELNMIMVQMILDSDTTGFWSGGSTR